MRPIPLLIPLICICSAAWCADTGLQVVRPIIAQSDGGVAAPPGFEHVSGETLFFSCRIAGYAKTPEEKVHIAYSVQAFDPTVRGPLPDIDVRQDAYAACEGAAVLVVLTEWDELRWLDFDKVGSVMAHRHVVDARNLLDRASLVRSGFTYRGVGRV